MSLDAVLEQVAERAAMRAVQLMLERKPAEIEPGYIRGISALARPLHPQATRPKRFDSASAHNWQTCRGPVGTDGGFPVGNAQWRCAGKNHHDARTCRALSHENRAWLHAALRAADGRIVRGYLGRYGCRACGDSQAGWKRDR